jgi:hypothetical protein
MLPAKYLTAPTAPSARDIIELSEGREPHTSDSARPLNGRDDGLPVPSAMGQGARALVLVDPTFLSPEYQQVVFESASATTTHDSSASRELTSSRALAAKALTARRRSSKAWSMRGSAHARQPSRYWPFKS